MKHFKSGRGTNTNLNLLHCVTSKIQHSLKQQLRPLTYKALKLQTLEFPSAHPVFIYCFFFSASFPSSLYLFVLLLCSLLPLSVSPSPSLSLPSPSLSKWVSSGVLAGRNYLRANTLLSVVKASPQIPFYTHKCHFPFVCTLAALAEPSRPRASSQTRPAEEN